MKATIMALQAYMKCLGHYTKTVDGLWGSGTAGAITESIKKKPQVMEIQKILYTEGYYLGDIDGIWGQISQNAILRLSGVILPPSKVAWSKKVDERFVTKVISICDALDMPRGDGPSDLMSCMAWESAETFRSDIRNAAGSGATGLIQFMPDTAIAYFHTPAQINKMTKQQKTDAGKAACERLAKMTPFEQLDYVYQYFRPYRSKLQNLGDVYMAILWPAGIGKSDSWVLWDSKSRPTTYRQNAGLDVNKDGVITRGECLYKVQEKKTRGLTTTWAR